MPSGQLEQAVAADEARGNSAAALGHALGGLLFGLGESIPFLIDAASFLASIAGVVGIRTSLAPERDERGNTRVYRGQARSPPERGGWPGSARSRRWH
ncbi:MAG: hypothetical protein M0T77_01345 [Actinomycetota bacterium]|nr:hypothetical protein [Actinomycetota bacterium]